MAVGFASVHPIIAEPARIHHLALESRGPVHIQFSIQRFLHWLPVLRVCYNHLESMGTSEMQVFLMVSNSSPLLDGGSSRVSRPCKPRGLRFLSLGQRNNRSPVRRLHDSFSSLGVFPSAGAAAPRYSYRLVVPGEPLASRSPFRPDEPPKMSRLLHHPHFLDALEGEERESIQSSFNFGRTTFVQDL